MDGLTFINTFSQEMSNIKSTNPQCATNNGDIGFLTYLKNAFLTDGAFDQGVLNNLEDINISDQKVKMFTELLLRFFSLKDMSSESEKEGEGINRVEGKNDNENEQHEENKVATIILHVLNAIYRRLEEYKAYEVDNITEDLKQNPTLDLTYEIILTNIPGQPSLEREIKPVSTKEPDIPISEDAKLKEIILYKEDKNDLKNIYNGKKIETVKEVLEIVKGNFITEKMKGSDKHYTVLLREGMMQGKNYIASENNIENEMVRDIDELKMAIKDRLFKSVSNEKIKEFELIFQREKFNEIDRKIELKDFDDRGLISDRLNILDAKKYNASEIKGIEISNTSFVEALEKIEKVIEQFSTDKKAADLVLKFKIDDNDILHVALKREGTTILVNVKTTNIEMVNMLNTQKETIIKGLVEKDISTSIFVYPDGTNGQEKRRAGEDERRNDKKRRDKNEFYEVLKTRTV